MRAHEEDNARQKKHGASSPSAEAHDHPHGLLGLQTTLGNAAVVQMLRDSGQLPAEETDVQRSTVHDVLRKPGKPLDDSTRADMETRFGTDFSHVRIHDDSAARASAAEVGARAYTSANHIVVGDGGSDDHTLAHELTHVIQQSSGPVSGTDHGDGLRVSDPSDRFEREAEATATKVMSAPVQRHATEQADAHAVGAHAHGAHAHGHSHSGSSAVQRMPAAPEDGQAEGGRKFDLQDEVPGSSGEDHVAGLSGDSEEEVYLKRGVTPTQKKWLVKEMIRGSFVSFQKILKEPDENATKPDREHVDGYLHQTRNEETAQLIEFTSDPKVATIFASESRFAYVFTIRIKRKYLEKGSQSEKGWMAKQAAPYEIVAIERSDTTKDDGLTMLTEGEFREAVRKEEMAEFLLRMENQSELLAHMAQFAGAEKINEVKRMQEFRKALAD
ncbi:DUF4765 family protein [Streptomyces sp. NPDC048370]|uniref:eCIS core domain-containing protein n=1 Tax=Streptomyces sp. NPDC048370 TaxID=3365540 RepID=UPI003715F4CE